MTKVQKKIGCCCTAEQATIAGGFWDVIDGIYQLIQFIISIFYVVMFYDIQPQLENDILYAAPLFFLSNVPRIVVFSVLLVKDMDVILRLVYVFARVLSIFVWLCCYIPLIIEQVNFQEQPTIVGVAYRLCFYLIIHIGLDFYFMYIAYMYWKYVKFIQKRDLPQSKKTNQVTSEKSSRRDKKHKKKDKNQELHTTKDSLKQKDVYWVSYGPQQMNKYKPRPDEVVKGKQQYGLQEQPLGRMTMNTNQLQEIISENKKDEWQNVTPQFNQSKTNMESGHQNSIMDTGRHNPMFDDSTDQKLQKLKKTQTMVESPNKKVNSLNKY